MKLFKKIFLLNILCLIFIQNSFSVTIQVGTREIARNLPAKVLAQGTFNTKLTTINQTLANFRQIIETRACELRNLNTNFKFSAEIFNPILNQINLIMLEPKDGSALDILDGFKAEIRNLEILFNRLNIKEQYKEDLANFKEKTEKLEEDIIADLGLIDVPRRGADSPARHFVNACQHLAQTLSATNPLRANLLKLIQITRRYERARALQTRQAEMQRELNANLQAIERILQTSTEDVETLVEAQANILRAAEEVIAYAQA